MLWHSDDICKVLSHSAGKEFQAKRIGIDSRTVEQGDLFVALQGDNFDGHDFIEKAVENGAVAVIGSKPVPCAVPYLQVADSLQALQDIARLARRRLNGKVIAVTGSVGKTTTKEMLIFALSQVGKCYGAGGNFNNHIGLPLTLVNAPLEQDFIVLEMGMNHAGEISLLADIGQPDIAIVTNVNPAHMMNFANLKAVAMAKAEIFESSPQQILFIGDDVEISPYLQEKAVSSGCKDIRTFGHKKCDYQLLSSAMQGSKNTITGNFQGSEKNYSIGMLGEHAALNSLVVMSVLDMLSCDHNFDLLEEFTAPKGRGAYEQIPLSDGKAWLIDESYNASPAAVVASIKLLAEFRKGQDSGRTIAILGDMLELGDQAVAYHKDLSTTLQDNGIDKLICVGEYMQKLYESVPKPMQSAVFANVEDFSHEIYNYLENNDIILLKASNSIGFGKIVRQLQKG